MTKRALIWIAVSSEKQASSDKISLIEQERAARSWCDEQGFEVVGVLSVPGESRSESDVLTIFEDFAEKNVYAYHDLRRMWQAPRQFDVLVAYHDTRLGRSEALYTYVISNVMKAGAQIYCILGGWYEPKDYKLKMAIGMINVSSEMDRLIELTIAKKLSRAEKGTLVHGVPCWAYKIERGEKGEPIRKVPNEQHRTVIEAATQLVLEGVGWNRIERELLERYGFGRNGIPYGRSMFFSLFHHPNFHGNEVFNKSKIDGKKRTGQNRRGTGLWVFDPSYPIPEGVRVFYNVLPPYLSMEPGGLGELLQAELRRRRQLVHGSAHSYDTHKFTGLLTCYYCGRTMAYHETHNYIYYICKSKYRTYSEDRCRVNRSIREDKVQEWFDNGLRLALDQQKPEIFLRNRADDDAENQLATLRTRRDQLDQQINRAVDEQLLSDDDDYKTRLRKRIEGLNAELKELERQIINLQAKAYTDTSAAFAAYERLRKFPDLDTFWRSDSKTINQILHGFLCETTLVVKDHAVKGEADRPR